MRVLLLFLLTFCSWQTHGKPLRTGAERRHYTLARPDTPVHFRDPALPEPESPLAELVFADENEPSQAGKKLLLTDTALASFVFQVVFLRAGRPEEVSPGRPITLTGVARVPFYILFGSFRVSSASC